MARSPDLKPAVCSRDCYDTCGLTARVTESGILAAITGDPDHPVTRGFVCPRGANDPERVYHNRIKTPAVKTGKGFDPLPWDRAVDTIAENLKRTLADHGPEAVLHLHYAGSIGTLTTGFSSRLWHAIGATQTDMALCSRSGKTGLRLHYGNAHGLFPTDLLKADLIVFWGFNPKASAPHLWRLALDARKTTGATIVVIDPRKSGSAKRADRWIAPAPGTDVALAYGIMNRLGAGGYIDHEFIQAHTTGFARLKPEIDKWPLDAAAGITRVSAPDIQAVADLYGQSRNSATMIGIGLQKCDNGADQVRAASFIPALIGRHRGFSYSNSDAFTIDEALISGQRLADRPHQIVEQVALSNLVSRGHFKFIYINCMNPGLTIPNQDGFRQGLARPDVFSVIHDTHWTRTAGLCRLVLPAPTVFEKHDVIIPWMHPFIERSSPVIGPLYDARTEIRVMRDIGRKLGTCPPWVFDDPWPVLEKAFENAFSNGSFTDLMAGKRLTLATLPPDRYPTPSGKIEFYSSVAEKKGFNPIPAQLPDSPRNPGFLLLHSAVSKYTSTQFQEVFGSIPSEVVIHPRAADRMGISSRQTIMLENEQGTLHLSARLSTDVPEDVLWMPRQGQDLNGVPVNRLMSGVPQKIGNGPRYNSTRVCIKPI